MKLVKRMLFPCLFALTLLTACQKTSPTSTIAPTIAPTTQPTDPPHICQPASENYLIDKDSHWQLCDCGKKIHIADHQINQEKCVDCGVTIANESDGSTTLTMERSLVTSGLNFPKWVRRYDADGRLFYECTYDLDEQWQYHIDYHYYFADGSWEDAVCDGFGNPTQRTLFDINGNVTDIFTYSYTYYPNDPTPTHVDCFQNEVLIYKEIYSRYNGQPFRSRRTDYRADGRYSVMNFDENGNVKDYSCFNADGTPLNHSNRYNRELGRPLVGSWYVIVQSNTHTMGLYNCENTQVNVLLTYTFALNGTLTITQDVDPEFMYQYYYNDHLRALIELTFFEHPTMEEKEAACQAQFGMSLHEKAVEYANGCDLTLEGHQVHQGVYFVEEDMLYIADSWITFETGNIFVIDGDILRIYSNSVLPLVRMVPDVEDYSDRFIQANCQDLFGTWKGKVTLDGKSLGLGESNRSITANVTVTFDDQGKMTIIIEMDPMEFRTFTIEASIDAILQSYSDKTPTQVDSSYLLWYGMTLREYITSQVDAQNPAANSVLEWLGSYFIENGLLYTANHQGGELDSDAYSLEGDKLIIPDPDTGLTLELTKVP